MSHIPQINIGLFGLGTVGGSVHEILHKNRELIAQKLGYPINIKKICELDPKKIKQYNVPQAMVTSKMAEVLDDPEISIIVELIGDKPAAKEVILKALHWRSWPTIARAVHLPRMGLLRSIRLDRLPRTFLILNVVMVSIYAIGVLASLYAGAQIPEYRATAIQLSAIVNGVATILLAIMVDPSAARVTDEAISGSRSEEDVMSMVFFLITGRLVATLVLAQLLLMPATEYIKGATLLLRHWFVGS